MIDSEVFSDHGSTVGVESLVQAHDDVSKVGYWIPIAQGCLLLSISSSGRSILIF